MLNVPQALRPLLRGRLSGSTPAPPPATPGSQFGSVYQWLLALLSIAILAGQARTAHALTSNLGLSIELVLLAVLAQHFPLPVGPQHKVDTSIAVYFACLLLFDTPDAVILVGIAQLVGQATLALRRVPGTGRRMRGPRGVLFNTSQMVLATTLAGLVYDAALPRTGAVALDRVESLWALPAAALVMHLTNRASVAVMVGLQLRRSPRQVLLTLWHGPELERGALFLLGLIAALAADRYPAGPLIMALPAAMLFLSQRRALGLLANEQRALAEAEQAHGHLFLLATASAILARSLEYQTTLKNAAGVAVPALADACGISVGHGAAAVRSSSIASKYRPEEECLDALLRHCPSAPPADADDGNRSKVYPVVTEDLAAAWGLEAECSAKLFGKVGPLSAISLPLMARGNTLGDLTLLAIGAGHTYDPADLAVAEDLGQRIALAIDNALLYEEQQQMVATLQRLRVRFEENERVQLIHDERERIARELHDRVEQAFFGIGLSVSALLAGPPGSTVESLHAALTDLRNSSSQGAEDVRAAIFALTRAEVHDLGLVQALWQLVRDFQNRTRLEADLVASGAERRPPPEIAEVLHAVAREGLANVEQHARASAVVVSLQFEAEVVTLTVQDDGAGASPLVMNTLSDSATRFGLRSIRERVALLGGTLTVQSGDDGGFVVRARVPL